MSFDSLGKIFLVIGAFFIGIGVLFLFFKHIPFIGKLPGDILVQKKNFTFYFPVGTSIVLSVLLSIIFYFIAKR